MNDNLLTGYVVCSCPEFLIYMFILIRMEKDREDKDKDWILIVFI